MITTGARRLATGPSDSSAYVLNMKPVYPVRIGKLNLINRLILPVIYAEGQDVTLDEDQAITAVLDLVGEVLAELGSRGLLTLVPTADVSEAREEVRRLEQRLDALSALVSAGDLDPADYAKAAKRIRVSLAEATVTIPGANGDLIHAYLARPLGPGPYPGMVVVHHMPGWDEWYREATRRYAHHGYVALSPNLYERAGHGTPEDVTAVVVQQLALQVAAQELGVDPNRIDVIVDTTRELGFGQTTGSRGTLMVAGSGRKASMSSFIPAASCAWNATGLPSWSRASSSKFRKRVRMASSPAACASISVFENPSHSDGCTTASHSASVWPGSANIRSRL